MEVIGILAVVVILQAVVSLFPAASSWPTVAVGLLLAGIALLLIGRT
jgi:hypothetical protein